MEHGENGQREELINPLAHAATYGKLVKQVGIQREELDVLRRHIARLEARIDAQEIKK